MADKTRSFCHLHNHGDGSMLDGLALVADLVPYAEEMGMPALALTDHGSMAGTYDLYKACKDSPVKAIHGIEAYLSPDVPRSYRAAVKWGDGGDDDVSAGAYTHITMLAETDEGLHNLFKMNSESYFTGLYRKNRIDLELLNEYGKGVIATTGCPSSEVQTWLRLGHYDKAKEAAAKFAEIFEHGNYYVEVMNHGLSIEKRVIGDLLRLAKELHLPIIATNDTHYARKSDAHFHEALLCISTGDKLSNPGRFKFDAEDFYLKSPAEMRALWDTEVPEACDNTLLIAERCNATFHTDDTLMPKFPIPEGYTEDSWFRHEVIEGLKRRFPSGVSDEHWARAEYEMDIITKMQFPGYFLVVSDFIRWAKDNGIGVGPGRGSGAGSLVAYALRITELDPIANGLLFERFLNPERISPPDIDIDFDDQRRGEVVEYCKQKYGEDKVVNIGTFMKIKAKAAIKDAARVLDMPYALGDKLTKLYPPPIQGQDLLLRDAYNPENDRYKEAAEFRSAVLADPDAVKVIELAKGLEGAKRGHGMHAAGVIMSSKPVIDYVPLMKRDANSPVMTQFEYPTCEKLGLIKMDFLGLSNLTTINEAFRLIKRNKGLELNSADIWADMTDPAAFKLLAEGRTLGVFQLDSAPMRSLLRLMAPDRFEDISAVLALYRPGPMAMNAHTDYADRKNGRQPITPIHPELDEALEPILRDTFAVIVYQEQIMAIAQKVASYSLGRADILRKAMGKKDRALVDKEFGPFKEAAMANGYSEESVTKLWDTIVPFASYAFNRAHSAAYGYISYLTAYLKANYPVEYMAALLSTNASDKDKTALYLNECRQMGVPVLAPDVNDSELNYLAVGDDIRVGMIAVKNVGAGVVDAIIETREEHGRFTSFGDFLSACPPVVLKKRAIESLIKAGGFDSMGYTRSSLVFAHAEAVDMVLAVKKNQKAGQDSLFAETGEDPGADILVPEIAEWDRKTKLAFEREMLGLYVTDHPLTGMENALRSVASLTVSDVRESTQASGTDVRIAGLITSAEHKKTRKGDSWVMLQVEDLGGSIPVPCFPRTFNKYGRFIEVDNVIQVDGKIEQREDGSVSVTANEIRLLDMLALADPDGVPVVVQVDEAQLTAEMLEEFKDTLRLSPGRTPVHVRVHRLDGTIAVLELGPEFTVKRGAILTSSLKAILGMDSVMQ